MPLDRAQLYAIALSTVLMFSAMGQYAFADNVQNDVVAGGNDTIYSGGSTIINYRIAANNGDGQTGCNAADSTPATVTINIPAAVSKSPSSLTFNSCGTSKPVTFSSSTPGNYVITVSISDGGTGTYNVNPATFTLHVLTPPDSTAPVITYGVTGMLGDNGWYTSDVTVTWTVNDPESTITSTSGCDPSTISADTAGTTLTCTATSTGGTASNSVTIKRDATAPAISASFDPATPDGDNGWYTTPVTVHFDCSDALSGLESACPADVVLNTDGSGQSASGMVTDAAGNSASVSTTDVNIDLTAPTITGYKVPGPNSDGWNNEDVVVSFVCSDETSGIASCTPDITKSAESTGQSATGAAIDNAGNMASATLSDINIDKTMPSIVESVSPSANANNWHKTDVVVSFACSDGLAGVRMCTPPVTLSTEGTGQSVTGTAEDKADNSASATVGNINIDKTAPAVTGSASPTPNANGWNNGSVLVSFSCTDALSGVASCGPDSTVSTEGAGQSVTGTAMDIADNTASFLVEGINIDMTAPTITGSRTPAANSNGWNKEDVTVHFDCVDALSGIMSCPADTILSAEGADQAVAGVATDKAANNASATVGGINIDKTAPVNITFTDGGIADGGVYYFGFVPAGPTACSAVDVLSGMDRCEVSGGGMSVGSHSYTATAYDRAGNSAASAIHYTVNKWSINGFYQPLDMNGVQNMAKAGKVIPTKWSLYAGTTELTDTSTFDSMGWKSIACGTSTATDAIETYATDTGNTELRYDPVAHQFIKNIKVPTTLGCYQLVLKTDDGSFIGALFNVAK